MRVGVLCVAGITWLLSGLALADAKTAPCPLNPTLVNSAVKMPPSAKLERMTGGCAYTWPIKNFKAKKAAWMKKMSAGLQGGSAAGITPFREENKIAFLSSTDAATESEAKSKYEAGISSMGGRPSAYGTAGGGDTPERAAMKEKLADAQRQLNARGGDAAAQRQLDMAKKAMGMGGAPSPLAAHAQGLGITYQPVPGVGSQAAFQPMTGMLVVRDKKRVVMVQVALEGGADEERNVAKALAQRLLAHQ